MQTDPTAPTKMDVQIELRITVDGETFIVTSDQSCDDVFDLNNALIDRAIRALEAVRDARGI